MIKYLLGFVFILGLIYMLAPDPGSINDFPPLPNSLKSDEPGDTWQVPNIAAYFSDADREEITNFYREEYRKKFIFGSIIPPISLNYPPIAAYQYVRDFLLHSPFLVDYSYPLRGSIFVNGYEISIYKDIKKLTHAKPYDVIQIKGQHFKSKTTIKLYTSHWYMRLVTYLGIWGACFAIFVLFKKVIKEK